jgi:hypothetical protein
MSRSLLKQSSRHLPPCLIFDVVPRMSTSFKQLNIGWNAEPNAPEPKARWDGEDLHLSFRPGFYEPDKIVEIVTGITFLQCSRFRFGSVNDEGWYRGRCRFGREARSWGEFYEVSGDLHLDQVLGDWNSRADPTPGSKHYLFYFRDEEFECDAEGWRLTSKPAEQDGGGQPATRPESK